jgi:outer membrane protein TolC
MKMERSVSLLFSLLLAASTFWLQACFAEDAPANTQLIAAPSSADDVLKANPIQLTITKDAPSSDLPSVNGPLGVEEAVHVGLKNNLELKESERAWVISKFLKRAELAKFGPSASFTTFFSHSSVNQMLFFPNDWSVPPTMQPIVRNTSLSLIFAGWQPLFTGGRLMGGFKTAKALERQSLYAYNGQKIDTALKVKEAYWEAAWFEAKLRVDTDYARFREGSAGNMKARVNQGKAPRADYLREESELAKARAQVNEDYENFNIALIRLKVAMGTNLTSLVELKDALELVETPGDLSLYLIKAGQKRPEMEQANSKIAEMQARRMVARSKYSPQVDLYGLGSNITGSSPDGSDRGRWGGTLGIMGSVMLFDSGGRLNELRAASTAVQQAKIARQDTQLKVAQSVSEAWIHLDLARKNVELAKEEVISAEEDYRLIHARYSIGKAIALEDFDASVKLLQTRLALLETIYKYRLAQARLIAASGDV